MTRLTFYCGAGRLFSVNLMGVSGILMGVFCVTS